MTDRKKPAASSRPTASRTGETAQTERIAKRLARAGVASRREAEALIAAGRIRLNGRVLDTPAVNVGPADAIEIDGEPIPAIERTRLFLFHKPAGLVTTNRDPEGRRTVFDALPEGLPRLITVGRLDINTEGLLLLTNDGGLARLLELPQTGWLRRYRVRVHGEVDEDALRGLKDGIAVDGVFYGAIEAALDRRQGTNAWLTIGLREGKNREVKNVMAALGLEVTRLIRISYGPFQLGELEEGKVQELRGRMLRDQLGPRLIAEAGANFDAPIAKPFSSNEPVEETVRKPVPQRSEGERRERKERNPDGPAQGRRFDRADKRDAALSRLSTKAPPGRGRGERKGRGDEAAAEQPRRSRTANVWMAPGARPQAAKTSGEEKVERVPRKPGDRKAKHDAAARRARPGRTERAAGAKPFERRERRPEAGNEAGERPKRDWKARPPRPGRAERADAAASGEKPVREYRPRPTGPDGKPRRETGKSWKGGASGTGPRRPRGDERRGEHGTDGGDKARPARANARPPHRERPSSPDRKPGGKPASRRPGGGSPGKGRPSGGPRKGPPKPRGGRD